MIYENRQIAIFRF